MTRILHPAAPNDLQFVMNQTADFYEVVNSRRAVRSFLPDAVPPEVLDRCLDAALRAPSSSNLQLWRFVVFGDRETRASAVKACLNQPPAASAPLLVALVARPGCWRQTRDEVVRILAGRGDLNGTSTRYFRRLVPLFYIHGPLNVLGWFKPAISRIVSLFRPFPDLHSRTGVRITAHKSTALAAATFMLAVRAEGYDSCPMEGFDPWRAGRLLRLKRGEEVSMFFAVGKRAEDAKPHERALLPRDLTVQYR